VALVVSALPWGNAVGRPQNSQMAMTRAIEWRTDLAVGSWVNVLTGLTAPTNLWLAVTPAPSAGARNFYRASGTPSPLAGTSNIQHPTANSQISLAPRQGAGTLLRRCPEVAIPKTPRRPPATVWQPSGLAAPQCPNSNRRYATHEKSNASNRGLKPHGYYQAIATR
jgi:hypothetical protein